MEKFVVQAAVLIATHSVLPFDLAVIDICDGQRLFSFLCIEWGIIADVDCDSEQYRFLGKNRLNYESFIYKFSFFYYLGEARFTVEAVKRILRE
jgi:hypothetical protein